MRFGHVTGMGYVRNACQESVRNPGYKRQGLRIKRRWQDIMKLFLRGKKCEVDWTRVSPDRES